MYTVRYYDTRNGIPLRPAFNSMDAAYKFINERLNHKDVQEYIAHLRNEKKLDALNYALSESQLYPVYGDIDKSFPSCIGLKVLIDQYGFYEYRIGSSKAMAEDGLGCVYFKISASVDNIRKSVCSNQSYKLNKFRIEATELLTDDYSRPNHD